MDIHFGVWDVVLIVAVALMATALAYLPQPKMKAFVLSLPIPFTIASLSLNRPMDATNVVGLVALLGFTHGVRILHQGLRVHIIPAIVVSVMGYCLAAVGLSSVLPKSGASFWTACVVVFALGLVLHVATSDRDEPAHRTALPVWVKFPLVVIVVVLLVVAKKAMHGFMTVFPMVGVFAAYEARKSLWTISRQIPVLTLSLVPLMAVCHLAQACYGLGLAPALAVGWVAYLVSMILLTWVAKSRKGDRKVVG